MRLRHIVTAFLNRGDQWLLFKRSDQAALAPGYFSGLGGHLEEGEFSDPLLACLREIEEESGLRPQQIENLQLKMLVLRRSGQELVLNYVYGGQIIETSFRDSSEGSSQLLEVDQLEDLLMAPVMRLILQRLIRRQAGDPDDHDLLELGHMDRPDRPQIVWQQLTDWPSLI